MRKLTTEQFVEKAKKIHGDKYDYSLVDYKNTRTKVKIICPTHGVFWMTPENHLQNHGCAFCGNVHKSNTEEFIEKAKEVHGDKYDYSLVDYKNNKTKVKIICPVHGMFEQLPCNHISLKQGCPLCQSSKGEEKISNWLSKKRKVFFKEYKFEDCKGKRRRLPFDFYVPEKNILIEYQGIQHYKNSFGASKKRYEEYLEADKIKADYAKKHNIRLLTIPYWDYNIIENILEENLL